MRVAIVGLGDIAQKAYLPVVGFRNGVELVFCTRSRASLVQISHQYRVTEAVRSIEDLLECDVDAAFVHTSTESHVACAERLLQYGIHVYVDKPLAYSYEQSRALVELAEQRECTLMVGFNRRFAPRYRSLKKVEGRRLIVMQKNRASLPDHARRFVFDDFIHVVDTLRWLAPGAIEDVRVSSFQQEGQLHHVMLSLEGEGFTAIGLMNRDSGGREEVLEVMSPGNKWVVRGLDATVHYAGGEERVHRFDGWTSALYRRGFPQIIDHFLESVRCDRVPSPAARDALETHALCERIVAEVERHGATPWNPPAL